MRKWACDMLKFNVHVIKEIIFYLYIYTLLFILKVNIGNQSIYFIFYFKININHQNV